MSTYVVSLLVVVGSVVGVVSLALRDPAQPATDRRRRDAGRPAAMAVAAPRMAMAPVGGGEVLADLGERHRVRGGLGLLLLWTALGTLTAGAVGAGVLLVSLALRQAAGVQ